MLHAHHVCPFEGVLRRKYKQVAGRCCIMSSLFNRIDERGFVVLPCVRNRSYTYASPDRKCLYLIRSSFVTLSSVSNEVSPARSPFRISAPFVDANH